MSTNKISDNVGKKIVEALRMQNGESTQSEPSGLSDIMAQENKHESNFSQDLDITEPDNIHSVNSSASLPLSEDVANSQQISNSVDIEFQKSLANNLSPEESYEYPSNVAVLCSLMAKLPVGVSRQTAAVIITQTMEALGIPMASVIQEAKQTQEDLSAKVRECQKNIIECKKQINNLEAQSQSYQRQVIKICDIISLFVKSKN